MPHILITDDDPHLRRLVRTYAELEGYGCTEAGDGAAAVTALKQVSFDLVLLDVMMPGPDGFETLEAIRRFSHFGQSRVRVCTGREIGMDMHIFRYAHSETLQFSCFNLVLDGRSVRSYCIGTFLQANPV